MSDVLAGPGAKRCVCARCEHCEGQRHVVDNDRGLGLWCNGCSADWFRRKEVLDCATCKAWQLLIGDPTVQCPECEIAGEG